MCWITRYQTMGLTASHGLRRDERGRCRFRPGGKREQPQYFHETARGILLASLLCCTRGSNHFHTKS
jgi:hypothetical protein